MNPMDEDAVCRGSWSMGNACGQCNKCVEGILNLITVMTSTQECLTKSLPEAGPKLVNRLLETRSLREVARQSDLSPTCISRIKNRMDVISPGAYKVLVKLLGVK